MGTFGAFLRSLQGSQVPDIAAFQEFSIADHGAVVSQLLPTHRIIYGLANAPESAVLVYNTATMQPVGFPDIVKLTNDGKMPKCAVGQLFQTSGTNKAVYIVSLHVPYGISPADQRVALSKIQGMVAPHAGQIPCIVMGDFNDDKGNGTIGAAFAGWREPTQHLTWSARVPPPPSLADGFTSIDYIFYTAPGIAEVAGTFNVTPTTQQSLIPQAAGTALPATPFFSDHVAMSVTFTLT
jgi:endonuclease/exonuclease/phosphatase family metal-dependent hydrolase